MSGKFVKGNVGTAFVKNLISDLITSKDSIHNKELRHNKRFEVPSVTDEQRAQTHCHLCKKEFQAREIKVIDHDHFTGQF